MSLSLGTAGYLIDGEGEPQLVVEVVAVAHCHQGLVVAVVDLVDGLKIGLMVRKRASSASNQGSILLNLLT